MLPPPSLNSNSVRLIEDEILLICRHCKTLEEISTAGAPVWDWTSRVLNKTYDELRVEIEDHSADEIFPDKFNEEKDHLLKIPLILLDHLHHPKN